MYGRPLAAPKPTLPLKSTASGEVAAHNGVRAPIDAG